VFGGTTIEQHTGEVTKQRSTIKKIPQKMEIAKGSGESSTHYQIARDLGANISSQGRTTCHNWEKRATIKTGSKECRTDGIPLALPIAKRRKPKFGKETSRQTRLGGGYREK